MKIYGRLVARAAVVAVAAMVVAGSACAPRSALRLPESRNAKSVWVRVTNHNWQDLRVYFLRNGSRLRLGLVTTNQTETFRLPLNAEVESGGVRLLVVPIGANWSYETDPILVQRGETLAWTIQQNPVLSAPFVR